MKTNIEKFKVVPKHVNNKFELCVYGDLSPEQLQWVENHQLKYYKSGKHTNLIIPEEIKLNDLFFQNDSFEWLDGFSPNLNKQLHIGHFSNLVLGKAFKSLGVCKKTVSIYGDTVAGDISNEEGKELLKKYQNDFQFIPDAEYFASQMIIQDDVLKNGENEYIGTKVFEVGEERVVGIKSNGQTSYFYQDVALAKILGCSTLYLTGAEQESHFNLLNKMFPLNKHIGLGLVKVSGKKMGTRFGNVILIKEFIDLLKESFDNNIHLIYNVFAGFILHPSPEVDKGINLDIISNPKNSYGLYLSYTMARLFSAGCTNDSKQELFQSQNLQFAYIKAKNNLKPNILFEVLISHCKEINSLYTNHTIKENPENTEMFNLKLSDLVLGCQKLGLFTITKV